MMPAVRVEIALIEEMQLRRLIEDFLDLLGDDHASTDPAIARLTPNPYPDDADAAREYRDGTRRDLLDRRRTDALVVRDAIADIDIASLSDDVVYTMQERLIPVEAVDAWLRTLTALRLVVATRLGVTRDEDHDPDDARFGVYDWLGYRLELLVQAADELAP